MSETDDPNGDGEGVWSPDIEHAFQEALELFPPCGRRKTILQGEGAGKMYGRNELIARHIFMRTGKMRTRKQVSSHIQVLARRKLRAESGSRGAETDSVSPASSINASSIGIGRTSRPDSAMSGIHYQIETTPAHQQMTTNGHAPAAHPVTNFYDVWADRPIVTQKIRLVEFSAFIEHRLRKPQPPPPPPHVIANGAHNGNPPASLSQALAASLATSAAAAADTGDQTNFGQTTTHVGNHQSQMSQSPTECSVTNQSRPQQHQIPSLPLASNHHLSAQFNQASAYQHLNGHQNHQSNSHFNDNHQQTIISHQNDLLLTTANYNNINGHHNGDNHHHLHHHHHHHHLQPNSVGFVRHPYVKIDYRQSTGTQANKLEEIAIGQIQDKFPEIGDPDGLFQRGPSDAFFLVKFWADLNTDHEFNQFEDQNSYFGFSSHFETIDPYKDIICSTKACSYGLQVVEKVEKIYGAFNSSNGRYSYDIDRSPMCEFMTQFIKKLRQLPTTTLMNSVLENFTVLQVVTSESTSEILLCLAYVFEIASPKQNNGSQYHVYKLSKGGADGTSPSLQPPMHTITMSP